MILFNCLIGCNRVSNPALLNTEMDVVQISNTVCDSNGESRKLQTEDNDVVSLNIDQSFDEETETNAIEIDIVATVSEESELVQALPSIDQIMSDELTTILLELNASESFDNVISISGISARDAMYGGTINDDVLEVIRLI